jgi:MerR family transcriptional regulator, repressor of the yfmOP operon
MSAVAESTKQLRIGEVAELIGTTPRTIRYYEEIGLLASREGRELGKRRHYDESDVERLREIMRLRDLLGVSLEELRALVEAEDARAALRREFGETEDAARQREILDESLGHICNQLLLLRGRKKEIERLERELTARQRRVRARLRELEGEDPAA